MYVIIYIFANFSVEYLNGWLYVLLANVKKKKMNYSSHEFSCEYLNFKYFCVGSSSGLS